MSERVESNLSPTPQWLRWIKRNVTREVLVDFLKTFIWVAPLSLLIWIYADNNTPNTIGKQPIAFQLVVKNPSKVVTVLNNTERLVTADLKGSRARLDSVKSKLGEMRIPIEVPENEVGQTTLSLAVPIQNAKIFAEYGIDVTNVTPMSIPVVIDNLETFKVPVVAPDDAQNLAAPPIFQPREITITAPSSLIARAREENKPWQAIADFSQNPELRQPGKHDAVVPIRSSVYGEHITLERAGVTVAMEIKANDKTGTIRTMPVKIECFKSYYDEIDVRCEPTIPNIHISGPADLVERLTSTGSDKLESNAILSIDSLQDPVGKTGGKPLKFNLPPGVTVIPEDAQKPFPFMIVKRGQ